MTAWHTSQCTLAQSSQYCFEECNNSRPAGKRLDLQYSSRSCQQTHPVDFNKLDKLRKEDAHALCLLVCQCRQCVEQHEHLHRDSMS